MSLEWWGKFNVPKGREGRLRIGPLCLVIQRLPHEWQVIRHDAPDGEEANARVEVPKELQEPPANAQITRFATRRDATEMHVVPILPDRTVLTRPERPLTLLPHTMVTLYVGSPVWVRLLEEGAELIGELPISPPKRAWLGPDTMRGELCYATRTVGRLSLSESTLRPHRVMTPVEIHNDADTPLLCEQVNLPVRRLSVFGSSNGRLFTETVKLSRSESDELARVDVGYGPPREADGTQLLSAPRDADSGSLFHTFGRLFA